MAVAEEIELNPVPANAAASLQTFANTPMGKNFLRGLGVAALVAIAFALYMWNQAPDYRVLFSNYSDRDGGAITAELDKLNIKHKFSDGGTAILIPAEQVNDVRLKLAAAGLPKGGNVGFELMENQKLGVSQFLEQVNFQRALEGELARSIESVSAVDTARVHLALPKPSVFVREQQKPTASVLLNLRAGRSLEQSQVNAIIHLVASSVPELMPSNVTLVDQAGNLLSDGKDKSANAKNLDPNQLKYVQQMQQSVVKQIESIIVPIVGEGNVRAEATADVDFAQTEQAAETYKPNSPPAASAIRSQQTSETSGAGGGNPAGVPGALSNQPPGVATAPLTAAPTGAPAAVAATSGPTHKDATTNFEVDKTVRYEQKSMGGLRRLSVAVVVNYRRLVDKNGKVSIKPISAEEMIQINNLVKEAMGYNKERGDSFSVANSPFDGVDKPVEASTAVEWWRDPANLPLAKELAKFLITALILLYLFIKIVRPMLRPVFRKIDDFSAKPEVLEAVAHDEDEETDELVSPVELAAMEEHAARGYRENLAMAKKLASEDPRVVANVIKAWVGNND
ncbi:MAG TPA: flagellar basal body M-ring protein FliF [Janthinobacterium sp.]|nr:flagellar basal body M-ring protein FliF [Janthinobacterium sp.]